MVLLRGGVEKEIEIKRNLYKSFEIKLIAFLKEGHGVYKSSINYKYDGVIQPFLIYIQLQPPGGIKEFDSDRTIKIKKHSLSSNSKCTTAGPEGLRCCHAKEILSTHECGRP